MRKNHLKLKIPQGKATHMLSLFWESAIGVTNQDIDPTSAQTEETSILSRGMKRRYAVNPKGRKIIMRRKMSM